MEDHKWTQMTLSNPSNHLDHTILFPPSYSMLWEIFKACLRLSLIPELWKEITVTYIPNAGKSGKEYRTISLPSFILKILETQALGIPGNEAVD